MKKQVALWTSVFFIIAVILYQIDRRQNRSDNRSVAPTAPAAYTEAHPPVEQLIRSRSAKVTDATEPAGAFRPVLIYAKRRDENQERFVCAGTAFNDKKLGTVIITCEHMLITNENRGNSYRIELLRGTMSQKNIFLGSVLWKAGDEPGTDKDIMIFSISGEPVYHQEVTPIRSSEEGRISIGYPTRDGIEIREMRSLISGETFPVIGAVIAGNAVYPNIECLVVPGESGTGFIDNADRLWVLHTSAGINASGSAQEAFEAHLGRKLRGLSTVAGPAPLFVRDKK